MADQQAALGQSRCSASLVERDDGSWYCPQCGREWPAPDTKLNRLDRKIKALEKELAALKAKREKFVIEEQARG